MNPTATIDVLDKVAIGVKSERLLAMLLDENPRLAEIMRNSRNETEGLVGVRNWVLAAVKQRPAAREYYASVSPTRNQLEALGSSDFDAIRILDHIDHAGQTFPDLNLRGETAVSDPIRLLWLAVTRGTGGAKPYR